MMNNNSRESEGSLNIEQVRLKGRLKEEITLLRDKLNKLARFVDSDRIKTISDDAECLLRKQCSIMLDYEKTLTLRLELIEKEIK